MSMVNWTRWMHSSVCAYLKSIAKTKSIPSLAEGLEERTKAFMQASDRIEIRFNGPYSKKSQGQYEARMTVNILVTSRMGDTKNVYALDNILGWVHDALDTGIPLLRTGSADDDQKQIGCLEIVGEIKVFHFGQLSAEDRIRQGMVTASYIYYFER